MDTVIRRIEEAETPTLDDINRAEDFSTFFKDKVEKIRSETSSASEPALEQYNGEKFNEFKLTSVQYIVNIINEAPNKYCAHDPAPT